MADDSADRIYINSNVRNVSLNIFDELELEIVKEENFKDSLLANLYSTVEFLKVELGEKNKMIDKLLTQLDVYVNTNV